MNWLSDSFLIGTRIC